MNNLKQYDQIKNLAFSKNFNILIILAFEKEFRIIVVSNDILLLLCKKRSNFDRELESDGQIILTKFNIIFSLWKHICMRLLLYYTI